MIWKDKEELIDGILAEQDFRPSYLNIVHMIAKMQPRPVVSAFTATATEVKARRSKDMG